MQDRKHKKILFIVLTTAFLLRLLWILIFAPMELVSDSLSYHRLAESIISGQGYHNNNLFAYRPPGYPIFLAGIYSLFGPNLLAVKIIQAILGIGIALIIYYITKRLSNKSTAILATALLAFYSQFIRYPGELLSENLFLFIFLLSIYYLYKYVESFSYKDGAIAGILLGLSALTREAALYFIVPIALWFLFYDKESRTKLYLKQLFVIFIFMIVTVAPWTIRNCLVFHKLVMISTNGGINFYIGNNPHATGGFSWNLPVGVRWPEHMSDKLALEEFHNLEMEAHKTGYKEGVKFIINNPMESLILVFKKIFILLRPPYYQIHINNLFSIDGIIKITWFLFYIFIFVAGIFGVTYSLRENWRKWLLLVLWMVLIIAIHTAVFAMTRFRLSIIPFLIIFASVAVCRWFNYLRERKMISSD